MTKMQFILRAYTNDEIADFAVASTPAELLDNFSAWDCRIWRIVVDQEDVAIVDFGTDKTGWFIICTEQTKNYAQGVKSVVQVVRDLLQWYYETGKFDDSTDLIGVRVVPV